MFAAEIIFGCGVIKIKDHQDKSLRKLHETTIAKKLRLGSKFPRSALHSRNTAVGIGFVKPKTEVSTLEYKLCIGNARVTAKTNKIIKIQGESMTIERVRRSKGKEKILRNAIHFQKK